MHNPRFWQQEQNVTRIPNEAVSKEEEKQNQDIDDLPTRHLHEKKKSN